MNFNQIHICDHIGLFTVHPQRLLNFYIQIMEFEKISDTVLDKSIMKSIFGLNMACRFIKLSKGELMVEIFAPLAPKKTSNTKTRIGINHFGYRLKNKNKFIQSLRKKKQKLLTIKKGGHTIFFIKDPDGNLIELRD